MSDFVNGFWGYFISIVAVGGVLWCVWLLYTQRRWLGAKPAAGQVEDTGHVWDGDLTELVGQGDRQHGRFAVGALAAARAGPPDNAEKGRHRNGGNDCAQVSHHDQPPVAAGAAGCTADWAAGC